jgi:hypothetical protein
VCITRISGGRHVADHDVASVPNTDGDARGMYLCDTRNHFIQQVVDIRVLSAPRRGFRTLTAHRHSKKHFCWQICRACSQFSRRGLPMRNHHPCCAVYIPLHALRCSRGTGRTSTATVAE